MGICRYDLDKKFKSSKQNFSLITRIPDPVGVDTDPAFKNKNGSESVVKKIMDPVPPHEKNPDPT